MGESAHGKEEVIGRTVGRESAKEEYPVLYSHE